MPEGKTPWRDFKLLNFNTIKSISEKKAGKILSAVSVFFTGCKRLNKRYQVSEDRRQRTDVKKTEDAKWGS